MIERRNVGEVEVKVKKISVEIALAPGTDMVIPNSDGILGFNSIQLAGGTSPNSIAVSSIDSSMVTIAIQQTSQSATADCTLNGVCHFDASSFVVDGNGFVKLVTSISDLQKQINNLQAQIDLLK
jgi:hypothetical protein